MHEEYLPDGELCTCADNEEVCQRELVRVDRHPEHVVLQRLSSHNVNPRPLIWWRTDKAASHWSETWTKGKFIKISTIKQEYNWEDLIGTRNMLCCSPAPKLTQGQYPPSDWMAYKQGDLSLVGNLDERFIKLSTIKQDYNWAKVGGFNRHPEHVVLQRLSSHKVNPRPLIGWRTSKAASHWSETWPKGKFI